MSEHLEQVTLVNWFDLQHPKLKGRLFAIPNGGHRHAAVAAKLKREGVRRGVPDLFLPVATATYAGLFIELKTLKGRPTKEQKEWLEFLNEQGYKAEICYGWEAAKNTISSYLSSSN